MWIVDTRTKEGSVKNTKCTVALQRQQLSAKFELAYAKFELAAVLDHHLDCLGSRVYPVPRLEDIFTAGELEPRSVLDVERLARLARKRGEL